MLLRCHNRECNKFFVDSKRRKHCPNCEYVQLVCSFCGKVFKRKRVNQDQAIKHHGVVNSFCSRSCSSRRKGRNLKRPNHHKNKKVTNDDRELLAQFLKPDPCWIIYRKPVRIMGWEWPSPDSQVFECITREIKV